VRRGRDLPERRVRRREHEPGHPGVAGGEECMEGATDVGLAVGERVSDRGGYAGLGREVYDVRAVSGRRAERLEIEDVALDDLVVPGPLGIVAVTRW
jgi:hypothetical protein